MTRKRETIVRDCMLEARLDGKRKTDRVVKLKKSEVEVGRGQCQEFSTVQHLFVISPQHRLPSTIQDIAGQLTSHSTPSQTSSACRSSSPYPVQSSTLQRQPARNHPQREVLQYQSRRSVYFNRNCYVFDPETCSPEFIFHSKVGDRRSGEF